MKSKCKRCGQCCLDLNIPVSPRELRCSYLWWKYSSDAKMLKKLGVQDAVHYDEIWLLYPALIYLRHNKKTGRYHYRCKHVAKDKDGKYICTIHKDRPEMCSGFPFYNHGREIRIGGTGRGPSQYPGCGYNEGHIMTSDGRRNK